MNKLRISVAIPTTLLPRLLLSITILCALCSHSLGAGLTNTTDFFIDQAGFNGNSGSTSNTAATFAFTNGTWVNSTRVFTAAGADLSGVAAGMWAAVLTNAETVTRFVGYITAVDDGADTITIHATASGGTNPSDGTGSRDIRVGGAWSGPNSAIGFPAGFVAVTMTNSSGHMPRVNIRKGTNYTLTAGMAHANAGPIWLFQGYTNSPGDGGRAVIDGGKAGASYVLLTVSVNTITVADIEFQNNGLTGLADGVSNTGNAGFWWRCVFTGMRRCGFRSTGNVTVQECESYDCNENNSAGQGGFFVQSSGISLVNCISHHQTNGANCNGYVTDQSLSVIGCIAAHNSGNGFLSNGDVNQNYVQCDSYGNAVHGFFFTGGASPSVKNLRNCNIVSNGVWGIHWRTNAPGVGHIGTLLNCGFGTGNKTNAAGNYFAGYVYGVFEAGTVFYPADTTPWNAPETGDFRISAATAKNQGRGFYMQTAPSYTGTVGYPDIGSSQATNNASSSGSGGFGHTYAQ